MNMRNNRRGFTLTELTIVLAVLAIILTLVVSFTAMVSKNTQISTARLEALQDIRVAESIIENFIEGKSSITFNVNAEETTLTDNEKNTLTFNIATKTLALSGGATLTLSRVESITFDYNGDNTDDYNGDNTEGIIYCTITYNVGNQNYDYTFCVYSYAEVTQKEATDEQG